MAVLGARWNLATAFAVCAWAVAAYVGAVIVGYRTMFLAHFVASGIAVYAFASKAGERVERRHEHRTPSRAVWTGLSLGLACYATGAVALAVVNLGFGIWDTCCSGRFGGEFGLRSPSIGRMLIDAFLEPLAWLLTLGALPAAVLGAMYGWLLHRRDRRMEEERA
jgi:hypothetical protein